MVCVCRSREFTTFLTKEGRGLIAFHLVFGSSVYSLGDTVDQFGSTVVSRSVAVYSVFTMFTVCLHWLFTAL